VAPARRLTRSSLTPADAFFAFRSHFRDGLAHSTTGRAASPRRERAPRAPDQDSLHDAHAEDLTTQSRHFDPIVSLRRSL
jgi:hypothetical protein